MLVTIQSKSAAIKTNSFTTFDLAWTVVPVEIANVSKRSLIRANDLTSRNLALAGALVYARFELLGNSQCVVGITEHPKVRSMRYAGLVAAFNLASACLLVEAKMEVTHGTQRGPSDTGLVAAQDSAVSFSVVAEVAKVHVAGEE